MPRPLSIALAAVALGLLIATLLARVSLAPAPAADVAAAPPSQLTAAAATSNALRERSSGTRTVDVPRLDPESCQTDCLNVSDARSGDLAWLFPAENFTDDGPVTLQVNREHGTDEISYTVCNATDVAVNPPSGTWAYLVVRP